jgi:tellurite resistance protein
MPKITPHEALIYVMITMSAADRQISDRELDRIAQVVQQLPVFMGYDVNTLAKTAERCGDLLSDEEGGLEELLDMVSGALPKKLHETAYALAVEVAAADLKVPDEEIRLLELLRDALHLDKLVTAAIERSARARHQTL